MNCRSMLARDLQSVVLYDEEGKFAGVRRPSSKLPIEINGTKIVIEDAIGSTGLDLKVSFNTKKTLHFGKINKLKSSQVHYYLSNTAYLWIFTESKTVTFQSDAFIYKTCKFKIPCFHCYQTDPGVPVVYAGFGALMLTTCISFLSHSQVIYTLQGNSRDAIENIYFFLILI